MDFDWPSVALGALLNLPIGILAVVISAPVMRYLERRTTFKTERRKEKAIQELERTASYKRGERDIYLDSIVTATASLTAFMLAFGLLGAGALIGIHADMASVHETSNSDTFLELLLVLSGALALYLSTVGLKLLTRRIGIYESFADHKKEVEDRFNITLDIDLGGPKPADPAA